MKIYFSDFFDVSQEKIDNYGAFNISLINDVPLFIDPFLLFGSDKAEFNSLHQEILRYLSFLKDKSDSGINKALLKSWFTFPEVRQLWLGYSTVGNGGSGLGNKFAQSLNHNLHTVFEDFGHEAVTKSSHLEKVCLIEGGVGRDNISDFTANLIKGFLSDYTQEFAKKHIDKKYRKVVNVEQAFFDYKTNRWMPKAYDLPIYNGDYVLLCPKEILTKDETWISRSELIGRFSGIVNAIPNDQLRAQISAYFASQLPQKPRKREREKAANVTLEKYPAVIDYYVAEKEQDVKSAREDSLKKIEDAHGVFVEALRNFAESLGQTTEFFSTDDDTFAECIKRVNYLKTFIEDQDGYRLFYKGNHPLKREQDIQLLFKLVWYASESDLNAEPNNGRGPVDFSASRGRKDKTLVEFKLASNTKLRQNLEKQVEIYKKANNTKKAIKVVLFFNDTELAKLVKIKNDLKLKEGQDIIFINADKTGKVSASKAK